MTDRATFLSHAREVRDIKLAASDFSQLPDVFDAETRAAWATYRQALRDYPAQFPDPCTEDQIPEMPISPDDPVPEIPEVIGEGEVEETPTE